MKQPTVGILYPGDMGSSVGRILLDSGLRVVTTLDGRSARTERLCREAGLEVLASLPEVARVANVVISIVLPSAALEVARGYAVAVREVGGLGTFELQSPSPTPTRLYVDANAVSPTAVDDIGLVLTDAGVDYVDAAIHGQAALLRTCAIIYVSGARAAEVRQLFGQAVRVLEAGDKPGQASAVKGALTGVAKAVTATYLEMAVLAREAGFSELFMEGFRLLYPGILEAVSRMLPSYPRHGRRRAEEMRELVQTMRLLGVEPSISQGAEQVLQAVADAQLKLGPGVSAWTADRVVEAVHACGALRPPKTIEAELSCH
jgi:3-hydroxyisobutyrate dehydrogenase-like beta-hydroxyacid dehydrogenase